MSWETDDAEVDGHRSTLWICWDDLSRHIGRRVRLDHEKRVCYTMHSNKESFAAAFGSGKMRIIVPNTGVRMWRGEKLPMTASVLRVKELHDYIMGHNHDTVDTRQAVSRHVCVICGLTGNPVLNRDDGIAAHTEVIEQFTDHDWPELGVPVPGFLASESDALDRDRLLGSALVDCPVCRSHWHLGCGAALRWDCTTEQHDSVKKIFEVIANYEPLEDVHCATCCWCSFVMAAVRSGADLE